MFNQEIHLSSQTAFDFGIVTKKTKKSIVTFEPKSISEDSQYVSIKLSVDNVLKEIKYRKDSSKKYDCYFIAWNYLLLEDWKNKDNTRKKASEYLRRTFDSSIFIEKNKDILPRYLILNYDLEVVGSGNAHTFLYEKMDDKRMSPLVARVVYQKEKHPLKRLYIAQKSVNNFKDDYFFINAVAEYYLNLNQHKKCEDFIKEHTNIEELLKDSDAGLRLTYFYCLLEQKKYSEAKKMISTPIKGWSGDYSKFLTGEVLYEEGKFEEAIPYFIEMIQDDPVNTNAGITSSYFLLGCYAKTKRDIELTELIDTFPLEQDELFLMDIKHSYTGKAEEIIKSVLKYKLDEVDKAKIKGIYAYLLQEDLTYQDGDLRKLTKYEKDRLDKGIRLITNTLEYFPNNSFFNTVYSNLLYRKGKHEDAVIQKIKTYTGKNSTDLYATAELENCSEQFLVLYPEKMRNFLKNDKEAIRKYIENFGFEQDIGTLWEKKMHKTIVDLYLFLKPYIDDILKIGETLAGYGGGGAFEIAYSLKQIGQNIEAKNIYEKILKEDKTNTAVLNNLALIFEDEGNLTEAKSLIKKAKENTEEPDDVIEKNFKRLHSNIQSNKNDEYTQKTIKVDEIKLEKKDAQGILFIRKDKVDVGSKENIPFKLLEALLPFGSIKGTNNVFTQSTSDRSKFNGEELSLLEKQVILRTRIKELQEVLKKKKVKVRLVFDENNETVLLKLL